MDPEFSTVAVFAEPVYAHLARARLEGQGIQVVLLDEHIIAMNPLLTCAVGGIKLVVAREHAAAVHQVVEGILGARERVDSCADCGAEGCGESRFKIRAAWLSTVVLGFPVCAARSRFTCQHCGNTWQG